MPHKKNGNVSQQHSNQNQAKSSKRSKKKAKRVANVEKAASIPNKPALANQQQLAQTENESTVPLNHKSTPPIENALASQCKSPEKLSSNSNQSLDSCKDSPSNQNLNKKSKAARKRSPVWSKLAINGEEIVEPVEAAPDAAMCRPGTLYSDVVFGAGSVKIGKPTAKQDPGRVSCPSSKTAQKRLTKALLVKCGGGEFNANGNLEKNMNFFPSLNELNRLCTDNLKQTGKPLTVVEKIPLLPTPILAPKARVAGSDAIAAASMAAAAVKLKSTSKPATLCKIKPSMTSTKVAETAKGPTSAAKKPTCSIKVKNSPTPKISASSTTVERTAVSVKKPEPANSKGTTSIALKVAKALTPRTTVAKQTNSHNGKPFASALSSSLSKPATAKAATQSKCTTKCTPITTINFERTQLANSQLKAIAAPDSAISLSTSSITSSDLDATSNSNKADDEYDSDADVVVLSETDGVQFSEDVFSESYGSYLENHFGNTEPRCQEIVRVPKQRPMSLDIQVASWNFLDPDVSMDPYPKFLCCFNDDEYLTTEKLALLGLKLALGNQTLEGKFEL